VIKVVLVIHLIIAAAMIGIVLLQKSEGGALGIGGGGGGGGGGFLTGRGTANLLTRTTAGLAFLFFITSLTLTIMAGGTDRNRSRFDNAPPPAAGAVTPGDNAASKPGDQPKPGGLLNRLKKGEGFQAPAAPQNQ
jgi:preprotein translocase subunit SecG